MFTARVCFERCSGDPVTQHQMLQQKALQDRAKVRQSFTIFFRFGNRILKGPGW